MSPTSISIRCIMHMLSYGSFFDITAKMCNTTCNSLEGWSYCITQCLSIIKGGNERQLSVWSTTPYLSHEPVVYTSHRYSCMLALSLASVCNVMYLACNEITSTSLTNAYVYITGQAVCSCTDRGHQQVTQYRCIDSEHSVMWPL